MLRLVLVSLALSVSSALPSSTPVVDVGVPSDLPPRPVRDLKIAATPDGGLVLGVVSDLGPATQGRGVFTERTLGAWEWREGAWRPLGGVLNYDRARPVANLDLALDRAGTPVMAWNENSGDNDVVVFRAWRDGAWTDWRSRYIGISSPQSAKTRALAALGGEPLLVWGENLRQGVGTVLTLRRWQGNAWARSPRLNTSPYARQPSLALDVRGEATAAWIEGNVNEGQIVVARVDERGATPVGRPLTHGGPRYVTSPRLALDASARPVVAWAEDVDGQDTLFAARWTGQDWQALGGAVSTSFASAPSLTLDREGRPVLAWVEERAGVGQVHLARWTGQTWRASGSVNRDARRDARTPSVTLDVYGNVVLAWREDVGGIYRVQIERFAPGDFGGQGG
ncbi:hypothetical protein [Deinococcus pimensis]|uniref:hypothetical protein n=1 Tax=Deinococcus pimensis TaxID=309888 RepID=UPI0004B3E836|nr:hypothetical protein [Deinococcus pimensis]